MLKQKYGLARCWLACDFRDKVYGKNNDLRQAGMAIFVRRVVEPVSLTQAVAFTCLLNPCSEEYTSDGVNDSDLTNGEPMNQFRRDARRLRVEYSRQFSSDKFDQLVKNMDYLKENGLAAYATKILIEKIGGGMDGDDKGEIAADIILKVGGPIQWILFILRVMSFLYHSEQILGFKYEIVSAAGALMFELSRTGTHELRSHHMKAVAHNSFVSLYNSGSDGKSLSAEASPVYDQLFSGSMGPPAAAYLRSILPQKALAQPASAESAAANTYRCNDGQTVHQHAQGTNDPQRGFCCEERPIGCMAWVDVARFLTHNLIVEPFILLYDLVEEILSEIVATVLEDFLELLGVLAAAIYQWLEEYIRPAIMYVINTLIGSPFGDIVSGARFMNVTILGADVGGNAVAHRMQGGKRLTPAETTAIREEEEMKFQAQFATLPLRERLFSTENHYSLASQVAMALPSSTSGVAQSTFATLLTSPLASLADSMASVFTLSKKAKAQSTVTSFHGISQYGIPKTHPVFAPNADPVQYWEDNCANGKAEKIGQAYNTEKSQASEMGDPEMQQLVAKYGFVLNPKSMEAENDEANPCFLLKSVAGYDQLPVVGSSGSPITGACIDVKSCAQALLAMNGNQLTIYPEAVKDLEASAAGTPITACSRPPSLNLSLLQLLVSLAGTYKYRINYFVSGHSCDGGFHPVGRAVDLDGVNGEEANNMPGQFRQNPLADFGRNVMVALPPGGGLGQKQCFVDVGSTTGKRFFNDACNHIHVDVGANAP
jgi:hypothetical protein